MVGSFIRLAAAAALCLIAAGCAEREATGGIEAPDNPVQCVPYVRAHSAVALRGDAYTWWDQAAGRFRRSSLPSQGAVMVLHDYAGPERAHVAVVRTVVSPREIRIDHANWLDDGRIYTDDPVRDVSEAGDWSLVKVYNLKAGAWGARTYSVQGFIGPGAPSDDEAHVAARAQSPAPSSDPIAGLIAKDQDLDDDADN